MIDLLLFNLCYTQLYYLVSVTYCYITYHSQTYGLKPQWFSFWFCGVRNSNRLSWTCAYMSLAGVTHLAASGASWVILYGQLGLSHSMVVSGSWTSSTAASFQEGGSGSSQWPVKPGLGSTRTLLPLYSYWWNQVTCSAHIQRGRERDFTSWERNGKESVTIFNIPFMSFLTFSFLLS